MYLPTSHEVYGFLKRLEARGLLKGYRDAVKPLSRREIARQLERIDKSLDRLTGVERDEFEFLRSEFSYELGSVAGDPEPTDFRWHLFSFGLREGIMNIDLNGKLAWAETRSGKTRLRGQGLKSYGYVFKNVGYYFNFVDYREAGKGINAAKNHTPDPGVVLTKSGAEAIEYNGTEAQLTLQLGEFQFSIEKMQNVWGYGTGGSVIFSTKAPSYPQFKMRVRLTDWMDFTYLHADLNSNIIDSVRSYHANSSGMIDFFRPVNRLKYLAAHHLEVTIIEGLDLSLGESVVYSDKFPQLIYLLPVMFFKSGEHYNRDTDNVQWFGSLDVNLVRGLNFYFSVLIDELNTDDLLRPGSARNQLGYTAGVHTYDLLVENTELSVEYSRLNPWTYSHKYPAATFTNNGYDLGHWIGQNADLLSLEAGYRPLRKVRVGAFYEHYRKGGFKDVAYQYIIPSEPFLYDLQHEERSYGLSGRFQPVRDLFLDAKVRTRTLTDMLTGANKERKLEFQISASYGIW